MPLVCLCSRSDAATGFPTYNVVNLKNDHGVGPTTAYTPTTELVDSRLDWTVGRRGIPYLDWGLGGGEPWTRGDLVPYTAYKKCILSLQPRLQLLITQAGGHQTRAFANNYNIIRFADVLLWRAEC